ncbi:MAG: 3-isopropylmalate dehydratase small subunit [Planctomycetales bacterium]|nr:3-isopropylmalate dehydratase small subunit [Planctomycetales bacterium]
MIVPGKYLTLIEPAKIAEHVMEGSDPTFAKRVRPGDIVVAGKNFGCGSSREHAPVGLKAAGVSVVVAESFARIFYRNAINIGLPLLEVKGARETFQSGDRASVDLSSGEVRNARDSATLRGPGLSSQALSILEAGGLVEVVKHKLAARARPA